MYTVWNAIMKVNRTPAMALLEIKYSAETWLPLLDKGRREEYMKWLTQEVKRLDDLEESMRVMPKPFRQKRMKQ